MSLLIYRPLQTPVPSRRIVKTAATVPLNLKRNCDAHAHRNSPVAPDLLFEAKHQCECQSIPIVRIFFAGN